MVGGGDLDEVGNPVDIGVIRHRESHLEALQGIGFGPVDEGGGDELLVRHRDLLAIAGMERRGAHIDLVQRAGHAAADLDIVAHLHRAPEYWRPRTKEI